MGWVSGIVCLPTLVQRPNGLVGKLPLIAWHRPGDLTQRGQPCDAIDRAPGHRTSAKYFNLADPDGLASRHGVVEQIPVSDGGLLQERVVGLGDQGAVGQVMHVRACANEGDVRIGEHVEASQRVVTGFREGGDGLGAGLLQSGPGDCCQEPLLAGEVHVWGLMADAKFQSHLPQAELFGGPVIQEPECGPNKLFVQGVHDLVPLPLRSSPSCRHPRPVFVDSVNLLRNYSS